MDARESAVRAEVEKITILHVGQYSVLTVIAINKLHRAGFFFGVDDEVSSLMRHRIGALAKRCEKGAELVVPVQDNIIGFPGESGVRCKTSNGALDVT